MFRCAECGYEDPGEPDACPACGSTQWMSHRETSEDFEESEDERTTPVSFAIGETFAGRYRVEQLLGRGGMGSVYRVFDQVDGQERALKILHEGTTEGEGTERFLREIEILSHIDHPAVPRVLSWGGHDTRLYFVAEYVDGRDLKTHMDMGKTWAPEESARIVACVAEALGKIHEQRIVHRDIKPRNIIISDDGSVKLLDFGVARARVPGMQTLTKTGMVLGTPEYMSPEQYEGKKAEPQSDVYALGVILYQLLTGELPFSGNRMEIAIRILTETVIPPRAIRSDIPVWLDRIVNRCLQRDLTRRYHTAAELAADLTNPRESGKLHMNWLPGGDGVLEDPSGTWEWDLVLSSSKPKDWSEGLGLLFSGFLYRLQKIGPPDQTARRWNYYFNYWPKGEAARRIVKYQPPEAHPPA